MCTFLFCSRSTGLLNINFLALQDFIFTCISQVKRFQIVTVLFRLCFDKLCV